jgi:hypothetical protein
MPTFETGSELYQKTLNTVLILIGPYATQNPLGFDVSSFCFISQHVSA